MRKTYVFLLLSSVLPATVPVWAATQSDILYDKVERLEKDVMTLQRKMYRGEVGTTSVPTATGTAGSLDELYAQIAAQKDVIEGLTAKVDTLEYNQKQLEDRLNKMNADIDVRFNMAAQKNTSYDTAKNATSSAGSNSKTSAKEAYDKAYKMMEKGNYKEAEQAFTAFMRDYPKSDLVGNANYWLGETYYARKLYQQAAGIFADGFTKYKNNSKAPDNLLKLGLTMNNLGKKQDACTAFKALPTEFPKAAQTLKNRAKAEAKKLNCK